MPTCIYNHHFPAISVNRMYYPTRICSYIIICKLLYMYDQKKKKKFHSASQMCCSILVQNAKDCMQLVKCYLQIKTLQRQPNPAEVAPLGACSGCFSGCKHPYNFQSSVVEQNHRFGRESLDDIFYSNAEVKKRRL